MSFKLAFFKRTMVVVLSIQLVMPASLYAQQSLPRPTDRWKANSAGSYLNGINLPIEINNLLPELAENGINTGSASLLYSEDGLNLTVDQQSARLLAYWSSFDIGGNNAVTFIQPGADSVALNIIQQQSPSKIFGSLDCTAACWLINPNGVFFGENSQVNARGFLAAAMEFTGVPMDLNMRTLEERNAFAVNNPFERENLFDGIDSENTFLQSGRDFVTGTESDSDGGVLPRIIVQNGASITSDNAPVLLAGPEVINEGKISSENGQVLLAGSRRDLYLALTNTDNTVANDKNNGKDQRYRGFLIEVDSGSGSDRGAVINAGELTANFGNVTLVASELVQAGKIKSTTAVDVNGSVRLIARDQASQHFALKNSLKTNTAESNAIYLDPDLEAPLLSDASKVAIGTEGGDLVLKQGSTIEIAIDQSNRTATDADDFTQPVSQINLEGRYVVMEEGASIIAPSAAVTVRARATPDALLAAVDEESDSFFVMDSGSLIDVSGTEDTQLSAERNTVEFFITSNELKDSPEQKGGALLRQNVKVDRLRGTPLFAWEVALDSIAKTANERAAVGGSVDILSNSAVSIGENASIDVSGGRLNYAAGTVEASRVLGQNGWIDISEASPLSPYFGVSTSESSQFNHPKWGSVTSFRPTPTISRYHRAAYFEGMSAGAIVINSPQQAIADTAHLQLDTTLGQYQLLQTSGVPAGGSLSLNLAAQGESSIAIVGMGEVDFVNQIIDRELRLTRDLLEQSGAAEITLAAGLAYRQNEDLQFNEGTDFSVSGGSIYLDHNIRTVGGDVSLTQNSNLGELAVSGVINSAGSWTNDLAVASNLQRTVPLAISGGDIRLAAKNSMILADGAAFDSSAGAWLSARGKLKVGNAGDISFSLKTDKAEPATLAVAGPLDVRAMDAGAGGTLTLATNSVTFGDFEASSLSENLMIDNSFFEKGLVGGYEFTALDGNVFATSGAIIDLRHQSFVVKEGIDNKQSSSSTGGIFTTDFFPDYMNASGKLALTAIRKSAVNDQAGVIRLDTDSKIIGPAYSTIDLQANNRVLVNGEITSPGGSFSAVLKQREREQDNTSLKNYILVGDDAAINLSADAYKIPTYDGTEVFRTIAAGRFTLDAKYGFSLIAPDAKIQLKGRTVNSLERVYSGRNNIGNIENRRVDLAAGTVDISGEYGLQVGAVFDFGNNDTGDNSSGDSNAGFPGGVINLSLDAGERSILDTTSLFPELNFLLGQSYTGTQLSNIVFDENVSNSFVGIGAINAQNFSDNNLSRLSINVDNTEKTGISNRLNQISLVDDVSLATVDSLVLDAPTLNLNNHTLDLHAAYMQLGETSSQANGQIGRTAIAGTGTLFAAGELIDLYGNLTINGADQLNLFASNGIRYRSVIRQVGGYDEKGAGALTTSANVLLGTPRMWGATLADFRFNLVGTDSVFELGNTGNTIAPVISFGSELTINADTIRIDSAIHNPFGSITLDATEEVILGANANLSVAGTGVTPFGRQLADQALWFYNFATGGSGIIQYDENSPLPEKFVELKAPVITTDPNSVVDVAGGGSVFSREFVAGLGGTVDILSNADSSNYFAIVPTQTGGFAPYDEMEYRGSNIPLGSEIVISGSQQVADGAYTIMPASYGLLPGAYLVSPTSLNFSVGQGFRAKTNQGVEIVAGKIQTAGGFSSNWSGFSVEPGNVIAQRANYVLSDANDYFDVAQPGTRPEENGRLILSVAEALNFSSQVMSSTASPVGASLDIAAAGNIYIGTSPDGLPGVNIDPALFDAIDADSILLGGRREWSGEAWDVQTLANEITIDNTELTVNEILISATDAIQLQNNSRILAESASGFNGNTWAVADSGIKLLVSAAAGSSMDFSLVNSANGRLSIDNTSGVSAQGTLGLIYDGLAPLDQLSFTDGVEETRLQVLADSLIVGNTDNGAVISVELLQDAAATELYGDSGISFNTSFAAEDLTELLLQSSNIQVLENNTVSFSASDRIRLIASGVAGADIPVSDQQQNNSLTFNAPLLTIESVAANQSNAPAVQLNLNSDQVILQAADLLLTRGTTRVNAVGDLHFVTPVMAAEGKTDLTVAAVGSLTAAGSAALSNPEDSIGSPGASFTFLAEDILFDTAISAQSGSVVLRSGNGDIALGGDALIDLQPFSVMFPSADDGDEEQSPAGIFSARAIGNIAIDNATAFIFGSDQNGDGGLVELMATGQVDFAAVNSPTTQWSSGNVDLRVQTSRLTDTTQQQLLRMNQAGFDGDIDILITAADENLTLNSGESLQGNSLRLASLQGALNVAGEVINTGEEGTLLLHGGSGVAIADTARVNAANDFWLEAPTADINVNALAELMVAGNMNMIAYMSSDLSGIAIDSGDTIDGATNLYLANSYQTQNIDGGQFVSGGGNPLSTALDDLMAVVDAQGSNNFSAISPDLNLRPFLDIYSDSSLTLQGGDINLTAIRSQLSQPGILQLRASADIELRSGINAATTLLTTNIGAGQILLNDDSWDVRVATGNNTSGSYLFDDIRYNDGLFKEGDLTLGANSFIRTGTGNIDVFTAGDLTLQGSSYIASVGRADYLLNPLTVPRNFTGALLREEALLPSWGDRFYSELMFIFPDFSGFSREGGNTRIRVAGDLTGFSNSQTSSRFIQRLAEDDLFSDFFGDYSGIRTWALAVDQINGGIHGVGGGQVDVEVAGDIDNIGFSTPGLAIGTTRSASDQVSPIDEFISGGNLSVSSRGSITHSSFANDGAAIHISATGILGADSANDSLLLTGSRTDFILNAGRGISLAAVLNSTSVPMTKAPTARTQFAGMTADLNKVFFDGYGETSLALTTASGDIRYRSDIAQVNTFLPGEEFSTLYTETEKLHLVAMLPGTAEFNALDGNILLDSSLALFPAAHNSVQFRAAENIAATPGRTNATIVSALDILPGSLANIRTGATLTSEQLHRQLENNLSTSLSEPILHQSNENGLGPIDRSMAKTNSLVALRGNIGGGETWGFILPNEVFAFAGANITNTTFRVQHTRPGQISQIVADGNIEYPINFSNGVFDQPADLQIELAGPGDLIVSAGGDLNLGASSGIQSTGNSANALLPSQGANIHLFSGYKRNGNFKDLIGSGVASNADVYSLTNLNLPSDELAELSLLDWLPLFANQLNSTVTSTTSNSGSRADNNRYSMETIIGLISQATGENYRSANGGSGNPGVTSSSLNRAMNDWNNLRADLQLRIAASALKEVALANPGIVVAKGEYLFAEPAIGKTGFTSASERESAKEHYWNTIGGLATLEYLLTPNRATNLMTTAVAPSLVSFAETPIASLITQATNTFDQANYATQLLIAERVMTEHTRQSSVEGGAAGNALVNFERGYLAQHQFFGGDYVPTFSGMLEKAKLIQNGLAENIDELKLGKISGQELNSVEAVFNAWGIAVPSPGDAPQYSSGNMNFVFSSVRALNGGDINLMSPNGSINIGLAASQLKALEIVKDSSELGVLAFGRGNVNSVVANGFNVNESRTFSLSGGDINLWSAYGDIDAGRGAKTEFSTPAPQIGISESTGLMITTRPPAVSGSGIRTSASRSASNEQLTNQRRFYEVAEGAGATYLATALGIVDAGEAGIESAGDLFIAAAQVRGADNINVGGVSVGVTTNTAVGSDVAGAGNVANAATESVQESVTAAASSGNADNVSAFITIELLDTGT